MSDLYESTKRNRFIQLDPGGRKLSASLRVVGVGGGGCNAIESMIKRGLSGVDYIAINTDAQVLEMNSAGTIIQLGSNITRGLGAGADPQVGKKSAEEDREKLEDALAGSDMVFITAGMGGGTGTGAAPIVAAAAKSIGALVIGIVTKPFRWEGKKRMKNAEEGIAELKQYVDSLIVIPNERILGIMDSAVSALSAFDKPNEVLYEATRGISDIITIQGLINVDFADVRSVMKASGDALMGCGIASGENRSTEAAQKAISSPLLEGVSIKGAKNVLINISGSASVTMQEIDEGNRIIQEAAGEEANIIFGYVNKEDLNEYISYTVIATGFEQKATGKINVEKPEAKQQKATGTHGGGFTRSMMDNSNTTYDVNDLDIPTIKRMSSGFDSKNLFSDNSYGEGKKSNKPGDEDSSTFLRKIMD
ncbi:MAG: cell division protein FtsZ [Melioribacteraceae bacterium]